MSERVRRSLPYSRVPAGGQGSSEEIWGLLSQIEAQHAALGLPADAIEAYCQAAIRGTHASLRLAGHGQRLEEVAQVVRTAGGATRFLSEVAHPIRTYWYALWRAQEWAANNVPVSEGLIRRLHALILHGPRSRPTEVRGEATAALERLLDEVSEAEHSAVHPVLLAARVYRGLLAIAPFAEGNDLLARLLASYVLQRSGWNFKGWVRLEEGLARDFPRCETPDGSVDGAFLTSWLMAMADLLTLAAQRATASEAS